MKIDKRSIKVRDIFEGYKDSGVDGVVAYGGRLDVRPAYQREFVYKDKQRNAVIDTVLKGYPLNTMYWAKTGEDTYEVLDGQQRTISICQYLSHDFSIMDDGRIMYIDNWTADMKEAIMNYELEVYVCEGGDAEKLEWFKTINIAGEELTDQELRNAVYSGPWVTDCKRHFTKVGCPGIKIGEKFVTVKLDRQGLMERALQWIAIRYGCSIEEYMATHQHDMECEELWNYYRAIIDWVKATFISIRPSMKSVNWGMLYHKYGSGHYDVDALEAEVSRLHADDDVKSQSGIYEYVFDHDERHLNIRAFDKKEKLRAYEKQQGKCPICGLTYKIEEMEADHIIPWSKGGHTDVDNCQCLCRKCNNKKSDTL